ncbi:MAG: molybdate ABC transporter permease subunit [Spiribacter sp.]|jgi:molybdate transport system permease protein|nr:molybdate ABC transporter permease subunit [Spiribacter sp.]MDR9488716.1 molybdate ABC transporter permease subunit [Spiribacter sp.]
MNLMPVWISIQLASVTVCVLLALGTPLAWWLAVSRSRWRVAVDALVALPLVLPPTVLGFYMLMLLGPQGMVGAPWFAMTKETLTFSFTGLVITSVLYSLPFVVQPLRDAFRAVGQGPMEMAATLGAKPLDAFLTIACPLAGRGFVTAVVLGFAHTLGEFGAVLMVGGSIPGETRVVAIAIYEHVETLEYASAHALSAGLLVFSFVTLLLVYALNRQARPGVSG